METINTNEEHRYVSYFQSVLTIGIMSRAINAKEAEQQATIKMTDKNGINYCVFDQTPFELTDTEEWKPEFEPLETPDGLKFRFDPDEKTKNVIATRLGKDLDSLTDSDLEDFVKQSIEIALKK